MAGADVVQIPRIMEGSADALNLKALLTNPKITKIFHFARFDLAQSTTPSGVMPAPVYCTKIASRLCRTYTDRHGLRSVREVLNIDMSKQQQSSDWVRQPERGAAGLCGIGRVASAWLARTPRRHARARRPFGLAQACFEFSADAGKARSAGWPRDIFAHS